MKTMKTISYSTDTKLALRKLENAITRMGAGDVNYNYTNSRTDSTAWVEFTYKGSKYRFEYSRSKAEYFGINIPNAKDILIVLINGITDLARLAERGVFDFGQLVQGFKAIEFIEVPQFALFMRFQTVPRNFVEVKTRYNELVKGAMRPESNREDFEKLQQAYGLAKQYFGVTE